MPGGSPLSPHPSHAWGVGAPPQHISITHPVPHVWRSPGTITFRNVGVTLASGQGFDADGPGILCLARLAPPPVVSRGVTPVGVPEVALSRGVLRVLHGTQGSASHWVTHSQVFLSNPPFFITGIHLVLLSHSVSPPPFTPLVATHFVHSSYFLHSLMFTSPVLLSLTLPLPLPSLMSFFSL